MSMFVSIDCIDHVFDAVVSSISDGPEVEASEVLDDGLHPLDGGVSVLRNHSMFHVAMSSVLGAKLQIVEGWFRAVRARNKANQCPSCRCGHSTCAACYDEEQKSRSRRTRFSGGTCAIAPI